MGMFCYQCQETAMNKGCTVRGVCGKNEEVAKLQDLLIFILKGISFWGVQARKNGKEDKNANLFVAQGLFSTITNANFDPDAFIDFIKTALETRESLKKLAGKTAGAVPDAAQWTPSNLSKETLLKKAESVGVLSQDNEDVRSLRELLIYGIKGMAAYTDHAYVLDFEDNDILAFMQEGLAATLDDSLSADALVGLVLKCGEYSVKAMALLDKANTETFGKPEITTVSTGLKKGPGILVSGHDLRDLRDLLDQTQGKGINVYTHGEMLPANAYPGLKKYKHLTGNYGTSWWAQQKEFAEFNGPILMTTNCLTPTKPEYHDRVYTTGVVGWPGLKHIAERKPGKQKDFSAVIAHALKLGDIGEKPGKTLTIGFAHDTVMSVADKVIDLIKTGKIKQFVVMAGCDGRFKQREYHTELAKSLPEDRVILTAGCAKYRYNMLDLGDIAGIPRVLDAGQCNDSYSLAYVALQLKEVFGAKDINDLPISFNVAWYEQKAVCVLLALLYLGFKGIRLHPTIPAFLSPNVAKVLVEKFNIKPTDELAEDLNAMLVGK
ncbi:MAG: hydroxylamine reductase [Candidatus Auribacterota bacterium]